MRSAAVRRVLVLATALLLVVAGSAGSAAAAPDTTTTIRIVLQPDGDARITVTTRFPIGDGNSPRGFDRLAREFENGEEDVLTVEPFRQAADLAVEATGRSMEIRDDSRSADRTDGAGRLSLSFTWTAFARVADDRMVLGDAFRTPSGTWLPELVDRQELIVEFPEGYSVISSSRGLDNGSFRIQGPEEFEPGYPRATLERRGATTRVTTTAGNGTLTETPQGFGPAIGGIAILVALGVLVYLLWRRRSARGGAVAGTDGGDEPPDATVTDGNPGSEGGVRAEEVPEPPDGDAAAEPKAEELLSDEERVLRLLYENEGRMKQADIVTETDWSNAKVSQLLSEMDEEDRIEKLRIGRENLISLPGEAPDESE